MFCFFVGDMLKYLYQKKGKFMTKFITDNWIIILAVLGVILLGLVIALIVMDRKDKKLIAEYKASLNPEKETQKVDLLEALESLLLNDEEEKTEQEELEESLKEIEAELTQSEEELKNKEVEETKKNNEEVEEELEQLMGRSYTKHDD